MNIVGVRIDGRLVHGQVANLWTPKLQADRIIVVDEDAAKSDIEKSGLRMAAPATSRLSVLPEKVAADHLKNNRYGNQRLLIVAKRPEILLQMVNDGVDLGTINVGTMSQNDTTTAITNQINVDQDDVKAFHELQDKGVKLTAQLTPSDESRDFMKLLDEKMK